MKSLRDEVEGAIRAIQQRRQGIRPMVDKLLEVAGETPAPVVTPEQPVDSGGHIPVSGEHVEVPPADGDEVTRFINIPSAGWVVESPFTIDNEEFLENAVVASRPAPDGNKVELENRATGSRVWVDQGTFDTIQAQHLRPEYASDFAFNQP